MSDKEQKQESTSISPEPTPMNKKPSTELSEEELNKVAGGVAGPIAKKT
jgi:bacteriocin-like protein